MKQLTIRDNTQSSKSDFSEISELTAKIADKTLSQLEKEGLFVFPEAVADTEDITGDQLILHDTSRKTRLLPERSHTASGNILMTMTSRN